MSNIVEEENKKEQKYVRFSVCTSINKTSDF